MPEQQNVSLHQLVSFKLGDEEFGVDILKVQEIHRMIEITRVPHAPMYIKGVINLRGKVIPIVDLRKRFGLPQREYDRNTRIMVINIDDKIIGFLVDSVSEVLRVSADTIEPASSIITGIESTYIKGVGKLEGRLLILLDLRHILNIHENDTFDEGEDSVDEEFSEFLSEQDE